MSLDTYSFILSYLSLLLLVATILGFVGFFVSSKIRTWIDSLGYFMFLKSIGAIAIIATISVLIYQFVYLTPVCILCWWQRIFMFPIDVIALVAVWFRQKASHVSIAILAVIGLFFALYHYYIHFQNAVLGNALLAPCDQAGLLPACGDNVVLVFGFVTIPLMAAIAFVAILVLCFFANKKFGANHEA